jgi:hypothetical protein
VFQFWGKPQWAAQHGDGTIKNNYRFYLNGDPNQPNVDLLDSHATMLLDAGVDFVIVDFTNGIDDDTGRPGGCGPASLSGTKALCNRWQQRIVLGLPVPQIVFFIIDAGYIAQIESYFFNVYRPDLFFAYLGKKLILTASLTEGGNRDDNGQSAVPTDPRFANYTARHCWGLGSNPNLGKRWEFKVSSDTPPPPYYYNGEPEQACAPVATQTTNMTVDGINPCSGARGRNGGAYFSKYMDAAKISGVKIVQISSWNEFEAFRQTSPGVGDCIFTDQWSPEYSSDIEPSVAYGNDYYDLMKQKIAEFKAGVTPAQVPLYRLYRSASPDHLLTASAAERDNAISHEGYQLDAGFSCRVWDAYAPGLKPFYRLQNPGIPHMLCTTDDAERDNAIENNGYHLDQTTCFVWPNQTAGTVPLYRLLKSGTGDYLYTASAAERDNAIAHDGYHFEQIACYVS